MNEIVIIILIITILVALGLCFLLATGRLKLSSTTSREEARAAVTEFREDDADFVEFDEEGRSVKTFRTW